MLTEDEDKRCKQKMQTEDLDKRCRSIEDVVRRCRQDMQTKDVDIMLTSHDLTEKGELQRQTEVVADDGKSI